MGKNKGKKKQSDKQGDGQGSGQPNQPGSSEEPSGQQGPPTASQGTQQQPKGKKKDHQEEHQKASEPSQQPQQKGQQPQQKGQQPQQKGKQQGPQQQPQGGGGRQQPAKQGQQGQEGGQRGPGGDQQGPQQQRGGQQGRPQQQPHDQRPQQQQRGQQAQQGPYQQPAQQQRGQQPWQGQQQGPPQQQRSQQPLQGQQQGPPQQQGGQQPWQGQQQVHPQQQRFQHPQQQRGPQPPQGQQEGPPQRQRGQQPFQGQQQGPPQQQIGQQPWQGQQQGPPQQQSGHPPWHGQQQGPPQQQGGQQPWQGQQQVHPQQQRGPQPFQGQQQGPPQQQQQQQQSQMSPGVSPPTPTGPPPQQAKGPQQQKKGQPRQQQPQPSQGQKQPSREPTPSQTSPDTMTSGMAQLELGRRRDQDDSKIVSQTRTKPGTKGRVIKVESNHLELRLGNLKVAYHYDVNIEPDKPKKFMRPVVESFRRKHFRDRWPAFDGKKNIYTSSPLSNNLNDIFDDEITITEEDGREKKFKVEIKFANKVDLTPLHNMLISPATPQDALQCVDIVLRSAPVLTCIPVGRSFFVKPDRIIDLGQGMEMYHGFYQSAIRGWKPLLNVDVAHKAFPKDISVIDALTELLSTPRQEFRRENLKSIDQWQTDTLNSYIKTLRVRYEIPGHPGSKKEYRVNGVGETPRKAQFTHNGTKMTIVEYFQRLKNYSLRYPDLPTLWVGSIQRADKILLPMELCSICEGQALNRKMTDLQTSKMIRHAATDTITRKNKIMQGLNMANYNQNPCVQEFGFSVGNQFQKLDARVLQPPKLKYAQNRVVSVSRGVWRNDSFLTGVTINKWTIANVSRYPPRPDDYRKMTDLMERSGREVGMNFVSKAIEPFVNIGGRQTFRDIEQYFKSQKDKQFDLIFVVVPDSGPQYSFVKRAAEINVGCLTQCIKSTTLCRKMNPQTAVNILLKVNSKLNGINHMFDIPPPILKRPVMIMGADVTHPGPDARDIPSVAAVTASHDPKAFQYNLCWRLQPPKMEIIGDLEAIMVEQLKFFYQKTRVKPEAIIFFRDGVSEGQFQQVRDEEIRAIRSACKKLQAQDFEPKITFLVVQKRHHTRLFPLNPRDSEDKNCNVPAGTCVDTEITHPFMQDFYLVSHASIQGVAKPTKYCTLWDDNNMDNDQIEELAYYLCHMFTRCNRSVSYPAPTYYAHLAAARAKVYIENDRLNMDKLREEFEKYQIRDEIRKGLPMFFV